MELQFGNGLSATCQTEITNLVRLLSAEQVQNILLIRRRICTMKTLDCSIGWWRGLRLAGVQGKDKARERTGTGDVYKS